MIRLQEDFTNVEQSKRLLEVGVPIKSANGALLLNKISKKYDYVVINNQDDYNFLDDSSIPSWSCLRLMEILDLCCIKDKKEDYPNTAIVKDALGIDFIEYLVQTFEYGKKEADAFDFSRLIF